MTISRARFFVICALAVVTLAYTFGLLHVASGVPTRAETRAWTTDCQTRTGLECKP